MKRIDALLTALVSTALLTACDPGTSAEPELPLEAEDDDEPLAPIAVAPELAAGPDWTLDQECTTNYFVTRQNESRQSACMADAPEYKIPELFPDWDDLLDDWMVSAAASTCVSSGARDGLGNLPPIWGGAVAGDGIDQLAAAGSGQAQAAVAPPACAVVCQGKGKVWNPNSPDYGTCAFNLVTDLDAPQHWNQGPACPSAGTRRWKMGGDVVFDCGCRCQ
ncbi:MAG: hypothetical protein KDK70_18855 [Myxococcales bacterium]|nr:hypothetical protein [Myxococcales bacterium]